MESYGLIIRHLRRLEGLSLQKTAKKIGKSIGWLSEVETTSGVCRLTEFEFNRIVEVLNGVKHKPVFRTWVATWQRRDSTDRKFDGAVLKFVRIKKGLTLKMAAKLTRISAAKLSKLETGLWPVTWDLRDKMMIAYGYSPSSFKNLSTDPIRSKVVPSKYKLAILLNNFSDEQIAEVFQFALKSIQKNSACEGDLCHE